MDAKKVAKRFKHKLKLLYRFKIIRMLIGGEWTLISVYAPVSLELYYPDRIWVNRNQTISTEYFLDIKHEPYP